MLKHRILTALILIPLFLLALFKLPPFGFAIFTAIMVVYAAWEWSSLSGVQTFLARLVFPIVMMALLPISLHAPITVVLLAAFFWWLIALILVVFYPRTSSLWATGVIIRALMGLLVLIPCWRALNFIRDSEQGIYTLLFLFILIWGADSGAYFVGKQWGKTKLAPKVSPGKSWQGLGGALVTSVGITLLALWFFHVPRVALVASVLLSVVTVLFSVLGDLFESMLKRQVGLKDSGRLLPGHGGILDRIDSLTAAAPIFALGATLVWEIYH